MQMVNDSNKINATEKPLFEIKEQIIPSLPEITNPRTLDVRYPLIPPYAYAHISWDEKNTELVYKIEEPELGAKEKEILEILEKGIRELINLSYISSKDKKTILIYLEKNIRVLLTELAIKISMETFLKVMYYIYRDFVGMNEVEPLMNDYFIEDIECNGINTPVYIVHRKYKNIRTNLIYNNIHDMASFVEKIAQKCGKYISYAEPLLDGALPDSSRVNATYSTDVSSHGPTFTIRKFSKEPWSPVQLIQKGSVNAEILAYAWMCLEYEHSFMVIGGTGSGKCVIGNTPVYLADGNIINIKNIIEPRFKKSKKIFKHEGWEYIEGDGLEVLSMNPETLKIEPVKVSKFWRNTATKKLFRIRTRSGREITSTPEHPFFTLDEYGVLMKVLAKNISKGVPIAVPRELNVTLKQASINIVNYLSKETDIYICEKQIEISQVMADICKEQKITQKNLAKKLSVNSRTFYSWKNENMIPIKIYSKLKEISRKEIEEDLILKAKTSSQKIYINKDPPKLFRFASMVIGDGHLTKNYIKFTNESEALRKEFLLLGKELFGVEGYNIHSKNRTPGVVIGSVVIARILNIVFEVPYGNKSGIVKVPEVLYTQTDNCICEFLSGIFDTEGYVGKANLEITSKSLELCKGITRLMLRIGISPSLIKRKDHCRVYISNIENLRKFRNSVNLRIEYKRNNLNLLVNKIRIHTTPNVDILPNLGEKINQLREGMLLNKKQFAECIGVSRRLVGMLEDGSRNPSRDTFGRLTTYLEFAEPDFFDNDFINLASSDILWDNIIDIKEITNHDEEYVYDFTIDGWHNFVAGEVPIIAHNTSFLNALAFFIPPQARIVTIEDTRELQLEHENWLPSVARAGVGLTNLVGQRYGEVNLFDLLKASFRQRPDYIIVGEIRGAEAYVLFQAFASGHPGCATMHAENVSTMIRRLETNPINLSSSLVMTLSAVFVMEQIKSKVKNIRKCSSVDEIINIREHLGGEELNNIFKWDAGRNAFLFNPNSKIFRDIAVHAGYSQEQVVQEFNYRVTLLKTLYTKRIVGFKEVQRIIHEYYKNPKEVLKRFGIIK